MSVRGLIDAIASGDSLATQQHFESEMMSRVAARMDQMRVDVARNMFKVQEEVETVEEAMDAKKVHPDALHVEPVGSGKYKVHAVGKNFSDGIKVGEHLTDTHLDDFAEMGGKIKHVKPQK